MPVRKLNCWEYMKCGREPGGAKAEILGICPAAADVSYSGIHSGVCGGRFCWAVAGTFCGGRTQGTFADKRESCLNCDFYKRVQVEEGTANLRTKFLQFVTFDRNAILFKEMKALHIQAGMRFIRQGDPAGPAYIIQRGACIILVEKGGKLHPSGHRGEGDIVGAASLLTGEPRTAHAEAETDMEVWVLDQSAFDDLAHADHDLTAFFTELVADRFDTRRPTAERMIGKYLATDIIGRGGYSIVYKGIDTERNTPVAIKMMRHDLALDEAFLETFENEARIIRSLSHPNIIEVFAIEKRFRTVFIVMEYVEGESLKTLLERLKRIPPALATRYLFQVLEALHYAHSKGILHRDINLTNLFVSSDDRIKILDFGLACPIGTEDCSSMGTLFYMAPEQILGDSMDARTDLYALGITAYQMVTGQYPFPTEKPQALMDLHLNRDLPDPLQHIAPLPEPLRHLILKAGRRDPEKRFQSAQEAMEALQNRVDLNKERPRDNGAR